MKNKLIPQDSAIALAFRQQYLPAVSRCQNMETEWERIKNAFTEGKFRLFR